MFNFFWYFKFKVLIFYVSFNFLLTCILILCFKFLMQCLIFIIVTQFSFFKNDMARYLVTDIALF